MPTLPAPATAPYTSMRLSLVLPFVMLVALLTGTLGVLWYWTGSATVSTLSQQLMHELSERIGQAVQQHMSQASATLEVAFPQGLTPPEDIRSDMALLRTRLWTATSLSGQPGSYVYYGNRSGQGIALERSSWQEGQLRLKTEAAAHRVFYRVPGITATPIPAQTEDSLFEPRSRPWYTQAIQSPRPIWLAVVAMPQSDMLAGIRRHVVLVGALGLLALGLALAIGLRIFGGVARDMRTLTHAVRRVGQGDIDAPIRVPRNDEIGELAHNFHHMRDRLFTDALTGVNNRSALHHILSALLAPPAQPFALLFIDLNRFKPLNDRWGHDNGDRALAEVAQRMRQQLRSTDLLARLGDDEFVVLLPGADSDQQAQEVREHLIAAIKPALTSLQDIPADVQVCVGASIGHALFPRDGQDASTLLQHADAQMYLDKQAGRAR